MRSTASLASCTNKAVARCPVVPYPAIAALARCVFIQATNSARVFGSRVLRPASTSGLRLMNMTGVNSISLFKGRVLRSVGIRENSQVVQQKCVAVRRRMCHAVRGDDRAAAANVLDNEILFQPI